MEKTSPGRLAEKSWLKILIVDLLEKKYCSLAKKVRFIRQADMAQVDPR
jgi:hypothetical protein